MSPAPRAFLALATLPLLAGLLGICAEARAQSQNPPAEAAKAQNNSVSKPGPKKPVRKPDQVVTDDPVALLGVKRTPTTAEKAITTQGMAVADPATATNAGAITAAEDTEKKAAEMASLEKQIQDKQKRIVLLMRLFVNDERPFLNDPAHPKGDEASQDQRKYAQDELLYETALLAKLKARLNELTAAK